MKTLPDDSNIWTEAHWEYHRSLVDRHRKLRGELVDLTIEYAGGWSDDLLWVGLHIFEPGSSSIQVDGDVTAQDVKVLSALLAIPSMTVVGDLEEFDFAKFEALRDGLRAKVKA